MAGCKFGLRCNSSRAVSLHWHSKNAQFRIKTRVECILSHWSVPTFVDRRSVFELCRQARWFCKIGQNHCLCAQKSLTIKTVNIIRIWRFWPDIGALRTRNHYFANTWRSTCCVPRVRNNQNDGSVWGVEQQSMRWLRCHAFTTCWGWLIRGIHLPSPIIE